MKDSLANRLPDLTVVGVTREMLGFLRKSQDRNECCGIYSTSTPHRGPFVLSLLEEFHLMFYSSVGFQFVIQKG